MQILAYMAVQPTQDGNLKAYHAVARIVSVAVVDCRKEQNSSKDLDNCISSASHKCYLQLQFFLAFQSLFCID